MHVEFILAAMVLVVAMLVAADFFRRTSDSPQEYAPQESAERPAHDAGRETSTAPRAGSAPSLSAFEPARAAQAARASRPGQAGQAADGRPYQDTVYRDTGAASRAAPRGAGKNWLVRARLSLLVLVSAAAAALATAGVLHAFDALHSDSFRSGVSSMREGAIASA